MSSQLTNIMQGILAALAVAAPGFTLSDTYKSFDIWGDEALEEGVITVIAGGRPESEVNLYYQDITVVGQRFIPPVTLNDSANGTPGAQINEAEGQMLDMLQLFALAFGNQVTIRGARQSMQLESPYCWVAMDMTVGPFTMDIPVSESLAALQQIIITTDATEPLGGDPSVVGTAKPAQPT